MKNTSSSITPKILDKFSQKKIYFAHQSVGYNIVDGIADIVTDYPEISLNVKESRDLADFDHYSGPQK